MLSFRNALIAVAMAALPLSASAAGKLESSGTVTFRIAIPEMAQVVLPFGDGFTITPPESARDNAMLFRAAFRPDAPRAVPPRERWQVVARVPFVVRGNAPAEFTIKPAGPAPWSATPNAPDYVYAVVFNDDTVMPASATIRETGESPHNRYRNSTFAGGLRSSHETYARQLDFSFGQHTGEVVVFSRNSPDFRGISAATASYSGRFEFSATVR
ncbi:MAG: hypothetical protein RIG84_02735 [Roseovarius sp.]